MKTVLVLYLAIAAVSADTALTLKWGLPWNETDVFIQIPRYVSEVISESWVLTARPSDAPLQALDMYCPSRDVTFCAFYDDTGYIAGLQIAVAKDRFFNTLFSPAKVGFSTWTYNSVEYWTNQQYFVSEGFLELTAAEREAKRSAGDYQTLVEDALWLVNQEGELWAVPTSQVELAKTIFTEQACIAHMGLHYFYNMSSAIDCSALYPWFTLVDQGQLVASGFLAFGTFPDPAYNTRMWFERPTRSVVEVFVPSGPACLYASADSPGIISMHIY